MLYLNPPFYLINGVSVFRDHEDPLQFYFLPLKPHLTLQRDARTGKQIPHIQTIKYRGRAGNGGFLSFDVNLGIEPEAVEEVITEVKRVEKLLDRPRLAPAPLVDGTVKMMLFGSQTGEIPTADLPEPKFVLKINHHAKPALYGDNQAAFSVQLDQYGITVLEQALQGEMTPIGIVYSLEFLALRPAYAVRLSIDWERTQKHMETHFGASVFCFSASIDKAIDELKDQRVIVLEVDTFAGDDAGAVIARRDGALEQVREMITDAFFEPSIHPTKKEEDGWDKATQLASRVSRMAATGGWSEVQGASFSYRKLDYTRIDKKKLNVNISERTTVKRSIYPQGHLMGLFRIFEDQGLDPKKFLIEADLDSDFFERRRIEVSTIANFEEDSIGSINVMTKYGSAPRNVILDSPTVKKSLDWASIIANGAMKWEVPYTYKLTFKNVDSAERPITVASPELKFVGGNLEIAPRELYAIMTVPIVAPTFDWDRYPHVEVQSKYTDETRKIRINDTFLLDEDHTEKMWKVFILDPTKRVFEYRLTYRAANHKDIVTPWVSSDQEQIMIRDPYPNKRILNIAPALNWTQVERAFVDVTYEDKANNVMEVKSFEFTEEDKTTKTFSVDLINPELQTVGYRVTTIFLDGRSVEAPQSSTRASRIIVTGRSSGHRVVGVRPVAGDFVKKRAKTMKVELRYLDEPNGFVYEDGFDFDEKVTGAQYFEFDFVEKPNYGYRTIIRFVNGMSKTTSWQKGNMDELSVGIS